MGLDPVLLLPPGAVHLWWVDYLPHFYAVLVDLNGDLPGAGESVPGLHRIFFNDSD